MISSNNRIENGAINGTALGRTATTMTTAEPAGSTDVSKDHRWPTANIDPEQA